MIPEKRLKRVTAGRQSDQHFRLAVAEVNVTVVRGDRPIQVYIIGIDRKMTAPGPQFDDTDRRDSPSRRLHGRELPSRRRDHSIPI